MSTDSTLMFFAVILVSYALVAFGIAYDAARNKIPTDSKPYTAINGAVAWFLLCLLFPLPGLVFYLIRRTLLLDERRRAQGVIL